MDDHQKILCKDSDKSKAQEEADKINKEFYGKYNYPWPPAFFYGYNEQRFSTTMLNQDIGSWEHDIIPAKPKIWVAGCGTNQAGFTALRFPESEVLGTDLSVESLQTSKNSAIQLGITNLKLEEKSINHMSCREDFDYIICTGVIHHNADPRSALEKISAALAPNGILELMVYNYYHMLFESSYQEAIRLLCNKGTGNDLEVQLSTTKKFINNFPVQNLMANHLSHFKDAHNDAHLADMLLQPILHSYTIKTFFEMIDQCDLECVLPCINQFDKTAKRLSWNMQFCDPETAAHYESLPDLERWQISNLLMMEQSPMLWFYLKKKNRSHPRKTEKQVCEEFLIRKFAPQSTTLKEYQRTAAGTYRLNEKMKSIPAPLFPTDELALRVYKALDSILCMKDIFQKLNIETSLYNVNRVRIHLTTTAFPYLQAIPSAKDIDRDETMGKAILAQNKWHKDDTDFNF